MTSAINNCGDIYYISHDNINLSISHFWRISAFTINYVGAVFYWDCTFSQLHTTHDHQSRAKGTISNGTNNYLPPTVKYFGFVSKSINRIRLV